MNTATSLAGTDAPLSPRTLRVNWVEERPFAVEVRPGAVSPRAVTPQLQLKLEPGVIGYTATTVRRFGRRRMGVAAWAGKVLFNVPWL